jgi:hypothetical protein
MKTTKTRHVTKLIVAEEFTVKMRTPKTYKKGHVLKTLRDNCSHPELADRPYYPFPETHRKHVIPTSHLKVDLFTEKVVTTLTPIKA